MAIASIDALALAQALIRRPSVTPKDAGALDMLEAVLKELGFATHRLPFGDVDNLYARLGQTAPHFCFAGHTDVVPAGEGWKADPFAADVQRWRALRPRRRRHEIGHCRVRRRGGAKPGTQRLDQPDDHRRRGRPGRQRHCQAAGMAERPGRTDRPLHRGRTDKRGPGRRYAEDRSARLDQFQGHGDGNAKAMSAIRKRPRTRSLCWPSW